MVAPPPDRSAGSNDRHREGSRVALAAREFIVGEGGVGTDEDVVFNTHTVVQGNTIFYGYPITDNHIILDETVRTNITIGTDLSLWKNDNELPNRGVGADILGLNLRVH